MNEIKKISCQTSSKTEKKKKDKMYLPNIRLYRH